MFLIPKVLDVAIAAWCLMSARVYAVTIHIDAIQPTATGQIGVNLVDPIPSAAALIGKIGKNTEYLTDVGSTTSWIGPDASFITQTTVTSTNSAGALATTTQEASVTINQDADGNFNILLGPALRTKLMEIAETIPPCGAKKRAAACGYTAFTEAVAQFGPIGEVAEIENVMPAGRFVIPANDIAQLLALFRAGAGATVSPAVTVGGGTLGLLYILYDQWNSNRAIPPALDVPNSVAGTAVTATAATTTATPSSTSSACLDSTDTPDCPDDNCKGEANDLCTVGDHKGCDCIPLNIDTSTDVPTEWIDLRSIIEQIVLSADSQPVPVCQDNNKVGLDSNLWKAMVTNVCASQPLTADISAIQTAQDVGFPGYEGWSFALSWRYNQGDCEFGCEEMFGGFQSSTQCSFDSHTFSGSGNNTQACGAASFVINKPIPAPASTSTTIPSPSPSPTPSEAPGPPQGVPICGNGLFFEQSAATNAIKTYCNQIQKSASYAKGPQSLNFSNVKIYNTNGTVNLEKQFSLSINAEVKWCPYTYEIDGLPKTLDDLGTSLDWLAGQMSVERCVEDFLVGVDGCAPFVAPAKGPFLKTVGLSYEDCVQWSIDIVEA